MKTHPSRALEAGRRRRSPLRRAVWRVVDYALLSGLAAFFLFPLVFMVVASFKPEKQIFDDLKTFIWAFVPRGVVLDNYLYVFGRVPFWRYMLNSILVTGVTVSAGLLVNSLIAFSLARLQWRGRNAIVSAIVALTIVPLETVVVPLLVLVNGFPWFGGATSWLDSLHVQIIPFIADAFSIYLFYQFFIGIPRDFDEAARVDGASPWNIYRRIVVPLSRPAFATVAILQTLAMWNSYLWPLMTTRSEAVRPLTIGITAFYVLNIRWGHILAFASLITLPVLILFLLFQKWFIQSVASTGIKG